jgi:hypothetical protein
MLARGVVIANQVQVSALRTFGQHACVVGTHGDESSQFAHDADDVHGYVGAIGHVADVFVSSWPSAESDARSVTRGIGILKLLHAISGGKQFIVA